jgi:chromosome partitioning protein
MYGGLKVLSSYHRKGGVGKTFLASTIAYLLAVGGPDKKGKKRKVLVLDYDSQQDSSKAFIQMQAIPGDDEYAAPIHPQFGQIDDDEWTGYNTSTDILFDLPTYDYPTAFDNIKLLPSEGNVDRVLALTSDPNELVTKITSHMTAWFNLPELSEDYDIIIIDNPPSKSPISSGILAAATHVLIPTEAEYDSVDGAPMLLNRIKIINETRQKDPLQVLGIIPNKIPTPSRMTQKDKVALTKLYDKNGATAEHMSRFFVSKRDCYRVMERPSIDPSHFDYVHNHKAIEEMTNLYNLVETKLWGSPDE